MMGWHGTRPGEGEVVGMYVDDNDDDDGDDDYGDDCRKWMSWLTSLS